MVKQCEEFTLVSSLVVVSANLNYLPGGEGKRPKLEQSQLIAST